MWRWRLASEETLSELRLFFLAVAAATVFLAQPTTTQQHTTIEPALPGQVGIFFFFSFERNQHSRKKKKTH
jgi:hypothetical protein